MFKSIGENIYNLYKLNINSTDFSDKFKLLDELDEKILSYDLKYNELKDRYDEEIAILTQSLSCFDEFFEEKSFYKQFTDIKANEEEEKFCPYCGQKKL